MTKVEFLAMSLPYGLNVIKNNGQPINLTGISQHKLTSNGEYHWFQTTQHLVTSSLSDIKPVLRPLSDLAKEITHDGETFVPIVELLKNSFFDTNEMSEEEIMSYVDAFSNTDSITLNDLPLYLKWHFNLMDEGENFIDVNTLETNPYK